MRTPTLLLTLLAASTLIALPADGASSAPCSSQGLRAERTADGVTYSTNVEALRVRGTTCRAARSVAGEAARRELAGTLGRTVRGYRLTYDRPCASCSPRFAVVARRDARRITFVLQPGG